MEPNQFKIKTAIISVFDKTGVVELAKSLVDLGIEIYSTGGTKKHLSENGLNVRNIEEITQFPEILDGRVKTLHPALYAGILARMNKAEHTKQLDIYNLKSIDLVICNLYPFETTLRKFPDISNLSNLEVLELLEMIDIGGPSMLRASAKNYHWTLPVVNPMRYSELIQLLKNNGGCVPENYRLEYAAETFEHIAHYDVVIANFFKKLAKKTTNSFFQVSQPIELNLRYGENPQQKASLFGSFTKIFQKLHGKDLSYNNILDIDSAARLIVEFDTPTVAIIKHTNPCGVGTDENLVEAYRKAFATDTVSPFGGIIVVNRPVDKDFATEVHPLFTEVIIAPDFTNEALELLMKKKDRRLIKVDLEQFKASIELDYRSVTNGVLVQDADKMLFNSEDFKVVTRREPTDEEVEALIFAWKVVKHVKSNAIVFAKKDRTIGIGAGQMSRVDSSRIAVEKAKMMGLELNGTVVASDAFFPFPDGVLEAAKVGATAVIQPGGSIRDNEVIEAANQNNIAMVFTNMRHFKH
ncbi:bifunctional phosphoribosylaminoimidazolecarboxamide formyltransferase/IMP cyclohydrolase PurH [Bacteroidetes/Chlorobi group bacterium Naka2016]|jgi:phosphoribosylaminoimidazolecarboxamide formyltransferase/IMP cyclohydrolase|nr:MAG: bifunctional phosphoribosylaminoimidazolecarboxamide formyltransferase/IMP cyclohydrolase PurH [Bacteroidetes/Chlorobi group bacterium Naka2016]